MNRRTGWKRDEVRGFEQPFYAEEETKVDGIKALAQSRRFWTLVLDVVISLALYFVAKYFGAGLDDVRFLIVTLQPIAILLIAAFTVDDMHAASLDAQIQISRLGAQVKAL